VFSGAIESDRCSRGVPEDGVDDQLEQLEIARRNSCSSANHNVIPAYGKAAMQLLDHPFYHPTYEEGLRTALREICDARKLAFGDDRDIGSAPGV
jgi:hypothetical protein